MISQVHIEALRELVAKTERELAGWRYMLAHAEQVEKSDQAARMPDPGMGVGNPWPLQPEPWQPAGTPLFDEAASRAGNGSGVLPRGVDPYPTSVMPPIDGSTLPPKQENALGLLASEHDAYAQTPKGRGEDEKWRQA